MRVTGAQCMARRPEIYPEQRVGNALGCWHLFYRQQTPLLRSLSPLVSHCASGFAITFHKRLHHHQSFHRSEMEDESQTGSDKIAPRSGICKFCALGLHCAVAPKSSSSSRCSSQSICRPDASWLLRPLRRVPWSSRARCHARDARPSDEKYGGGCSWGRLGRQAILAVAHVTRRCHRTCKASGMKASNRHGTATTTPTSISP